MKFNSPEEYWKALVHKNKAFKKDSVTIKTSSLKAIVFQAYNHGLNQNSNEDEMVENDSDLSLFCGLMSLFSNKKTYF